MRLTDKQYIQINQALFSLTHAYDSRMACDERARQADLALSDCSVLMVLGQFAPLNSRQLSEMMGITAGTISIYVQRLVEKGLVERDRDQDDRRNWWLSLSQAGQFAYQGILDGTVEYTRDFLVALDEDEQKEFHRLLLKASHSLGYDWQ